MDIDKLFKMPKLPGGTKRKLPDNPTPEMLKKLKMDTDSQLPGPSSTVTPKRPPRATVEDADDDDEGDVRDFAPNGDADYFAEEDDEGRFFGGGLTSEQKEILSIFERAEDDATGELPPMNIQQIRRLLLAFERAVNKNQDQRSKFPNDPAKFIDSEADLDIALKNLLPLSQAPLLAYPELVRSTSFELLIGLLTHENMDIVIDVVELIHELTDEDADADDADKYEEVEEALKTLTEGLVAHSAMELLVDNLKRLNEKEESDRQGVFHVLGIFENIIGVNSDYASLLVSKTKILPWILQRIQAKEHDENRSYAAELLSILLQPSEENRVALGKEDGIETVLKVLSQYRRRDPVDAEETEFMENLFDSLCSALSDQGLKKLFLEAEGLDLMILMIKEKKQSKSRSIKVVDHALSGSLDNSLCEAFVEALGLKTLFTAFMGKSTKQKASVAAAGSEDMSHILGIISSLLSHLDSDTPGRIRLLAKFVEGDYEKVDKLLEIRDSARRRLKVTDSEIQRDRQDSDEPLDEDEEYLKRLDGGLFTLQTVDYILAWIIMEDDGIQKHALQLLSRANQSVKDIVETLRIFHDHADDTEEAAANQKAILQGLISSLDDSAMQE